MKDFDYKNYLKSNPLLKEEYKLGDKFSKDFDYDGMVRMGLSMDENSDVEDLQALYNSFEDVNYHSENQNLGLAIDALRDGDKEEAEIFIGDFHDDLQDLARSFGMEDVMKKIDYNLGIGDERLGEEKKDHDGDGDIDSDDYLAARDKAIKKAKGEVNEMSDEEFEKAKEAERLENHPEKDKIKAIQAMFDKERKIKKSELKEIIKSVLSEVKKDEHGNHLEPQFQKGDKVTYLGNPGEITKVNKTASGIYTYSVSYDKGTGKTKASDLYNKGGEIKKA